MSHAGLWLLLGRQPWPDGHGQDCGGLRPETQSLESCTTAQATGHLFSVFAVGMRAPRVVRGKEQCLRFSCGATRLTVGPTGHALRPSFETTPPSRQGFDFPGHSTRGPLATRLNDPQRIQKDHEKAIDARLASPRN